YYLNVPFVIVRRDSKITEGSTVSVNYVSGSSERIEKMELSKRSLKRGSKVLVVDDFMKGGGTVNGMKSMIEEFEAELVGITVFAESKFNGRRAIDDYTSLLYVEDVDTQTKTISVVPGNYFTEK
ncbi:MAG: phosphoribosyltransferase family protein, partial [Enterococcus faecalis]|nr:phosphoribosyltransferase family protein [Enterococcus faecalis]